MDHKSTIVRIVRWGARISRTVAPGLASRWLERLFLTTRRRPAPPREVEWLADARRATLQVGEHQVPIHRWGRHGPTVLLVHGWDGRGSQMGAFVEPLCRAGYQVVAFDAPGHGAATGRSCSLPLLADTVAAVAHHIGDVHGLIAHSLGTAATSIAISRGLRVERLVYVAPPEDPGAYLRLAAGFLGFGDAVAARAQVRLEARFDIAFDGVRGRALAPGFGVPGLLFHDVTDREVPIGEGRALAAAWPEARLVETDGLGHNRILRDPAVVEQAVAFIDAGADRATEAA